LQQQKRCLNTLHIVQPKRTNKKISFENLDKNCNSLFQVDKYNTFCLMSSFVDINLDAFAYFFVVYAFHSKKLICAFLFNYFHDFQCVFIGLNCYTCKNVETVLAVVFCQWHSKSGVAKVRPYNLFLRPFDLFVI